MANKVLTVNNLTTSFNKKIIDSISFSVDYGSITAILCPNGGGKTTLIKSLAGILFFNTGEICIDGVVLSKKEYSKFILLISTILDDIDNQFICSNVYDELCYPLINLGYSNIKTARIVDSISSSLKIKSLLDKDIDLLTTYEKVKVLLASSIVHMPKILFIDDVTRFLNNKEKNDILKLIKLINKKYKIAIIYTTSDINDVIDLERVIVLNKGKITMDDSFNNIILKDNELSKMGFNIPIMIDLSRKLQFYKLVDRIYYEPEKVVDKLWN